MAARIRSADTNKNGATALFLAALHGRGDYVRLLLEAGADPTIPNNGGKVARDAALEEGYPKVAALIPAAA